MFDEESQIGAGEYTFTYEIRTHGAIIVRIKDGKISNWREYEEASPLDWEEFMGRTAFEGRRHGAGWAGRYHSVMSTGPDYGPEAGGLKRRTMARFSESLAWKESQS